MAESLYDGQRAAPAPLGPASVRRLVPVPGGPPGSTRVVDQDAAERAVLDLLVALGLDPSDEGLADTPRRVAAAFADCLEPRSWTLTTFSNDDGYDQLVLARSIPFHSLCVRHLLPFIGVAHVGYLPADRILGLSKLARVVDMFARGLQTQEGLTSQVARWLDEHLRPKGVGVILQAEHLCMSLRGAQVHGATTTTSALLGAVREDARTRGEFMSLALGGAGQGVR